MSARWLLLMFAIAALACGAEDGAASSAGGTGATAGAPGGNAGAAAGGPGGAGGSAGAAGFGNAGDAGFGNGGEAGLGAAGGAAGSAGAPSCSYPLRPVGSGPIFVHYVGVPSQPLMDALAGKGENVMVTRSVGPCGVQNDTVAYWRSKGGKWAYKLSRDEAPKVLAGDPVAWFKSKIDKGWDYVAFDEFRGAAQGYHDGTAEGQKLIAMMNDLPAPYAGRFIAYWSSGGIGDIPTAYPKMIKTMASKGRAILLERYLYSHASRPSATRSTSPSARRPLRSPPGSKASSPSSSASTTTTPRAMAVTSTSTAQPRTSCPTRAAFSIASSRPCTRGPAPTVSPARAPTRSRG